MPNNELGEYLRKLRGKESLREVSNRIKGELSHSYISDIEKGVNRRGNPIKPSPETLKILSEAYATDYAKLMVLAGYIDTDNHISEISNVTSAKDSELINASHPIPVYGSIHAGSPGFAEQNIIGMTMATDRIIRDYGAKNLFALQISGDSMNRIVPNGHTAVFAKDAAIENGDIVAVLIDHEEATIKRFKETSLAVILEPESYYDSYKPIVFPKEGEQDFEIIGKYLYESSLPI